MKFIPLLILFSISSLTFAQNLQGEVSYDIWSNVRNYETIDTTEYLIEYAFNALDIQNEDTYIDLQWLEIGKHQNKYSSRYVYVSDSIRTDYMLDPNAPDTWPNSWLPHGRNSYGNWGELKYHVLYSSFGKIRTFTRELSRAYNGYYDESYPGMQWQMHAEMMNVCGHLCQKATCKYHGRTFEAWFTLEIPFSYGPWKFGGLPGLILKVYDIDHLYTFECIQIQSVKFPMLSVTDCYYNRPVDRKKVLEFERRVNVNWMKTVNIQYVDPITLMPNGKQKPDSPYDPIELE